MLDLVGTIASCGLQCESDAKRVPDTRQAYTDGLLQAM